MIDDNYIAISDEDDVITVSTVAVGFTTAKLTATSGRFKGRAVDGALVTVEDDNIRYRVTGTNPTASIGHLVYEDGSVFIEGAENVRNFLAIRQTTDATIYCTYYCLRK